jgi:hypothetical protein
MVPNVGLLAIRAKFEHTMHTSRTELQKRRSPASRPRALLDAKMASAKACFNLSRVAG